MKDLTGFRSGMLTAIEYTGKKQGGGAIWKCQCDCGNFREVWIGNLSNQHTQSCGCTTRARRHGMYNTPTYRSYRKMLDRTRYEEYSEWYEGVTVCDRWDTAKGGSFENFLEDMGERPEGHTLNRVRSAKEYSKENCEWTSLSRQSFDTKKKRTNKSGRTGVKLRSDRNKWEARITVDGKVKLLYYGDSFEEACKAREAAEVLYYGFIKE